MAKHMFNFFFFNILCVLEENVFSLFECIFVF